MFINNVQTKEVAEKILNHVKDKTALITIAEATNIDVLSLIEELKTLKVKFIGGIFPKVIHENNICDEGIVINTLYNVFHTSVIENISTKEFDVPEIIYERDTNYSLLTYVDGLTSNISNYLSSLYESYGMNTNYLGGGAGSLTLEQKPCVFSEEGLFMDAAVICMMKTKSSIGVAHGWEKLSGPYIITKADKNTIQGINWENPFKTYKAVVEKDSGQKFNDNNFFELAKGYPFGIVKQGNESVIRDPLMVNENEELICVGEVEENTMVNIMKGDNKSLIAAAKKAAKASLKDAVIPQKAIIIDCISRILFLEEDFQKELNKIVDTLRSKHPEISVGGALTLGEISSFGNGYLEFYNKTVVVSLFE